ncbi:hypothetical protein LSUE1_G001912 [Lachnellula suecica]|uniref:Zn(2)-C6 fungal-type domain-containing protein n=1 Tax=Lachnellula suecica TaxID=602035 RepID=A0A8T9CAE1_9HELO|nr:hypothetical protein LSUE1_G001912 [Lachnellula suecica]
MNRRSRKGCFDCKKAKVKCDEVRPSCGTCRRRGYVCQGYVFTQYPKISVKEEERNNFDKSRFERIAKTEHIATSPDTSLAAKRIQNSDSVHDSSSDHPNIDGSGAISVIVRSANPSISDSEMSGVDSQCRSPQLCRKVPTIPVGTIPDADESVLEMYFRRHPVDQVIDTKFVEEMNINVLQTFHMDPAAVSDSLSAIGHIYLADGQAPLIPILDRRARILSRLRTQRDLEPMLAMFLGLCALEMIDYTCLPADSTLPTLIANAAMFLDGHQSTGKGFSSVAKYFIRALARQDMIIALAYSRSPLIPSSIWLDEDCQHCPDRFMGYTVTLMPILACLSTLAGDVRERSKKRSRSVSQIDLEPGPNDADTLPELLKRAENIQMSLAIWHPNAARTSSFHSSKDLLLHAYAYKAAALLYLHRIVNPAGISKDADKASASIVYGKQGIVGNTGIGSTWSISTLENVYLSEVWLGSFSTSNIQHEHQRLAASYTMLGSADSLGLSSFQAASFNSS